MVRGEPSERVLAPAAREALRTAIEAAGGNEVMFVGRIEDERVVEVEAVARGNAAMVPAVLSRVDGFDVVIHNHPGGDLTPSDADLHVAALFADRGVGSYVVSNDAARVYAIVERIPRPEPPEPLEASEIEALFSDRGPISKAFSSYERREPQVLMAKRVAGALGSKHVALVEAGTGTGKSLAYLLPALLTAKRRGGRVVVATHTIHLQRQILQKDLPGIVRAWPSIAGAESDPPRVALAKGRGNYVCLRRVDEVPELPAAAFESELEKRAVLELVHWAKRGLETEAHGGSRDELGALPSARAWEFVVADADSCNGVKCSRYAECFYYQARREAARADLVVANHALLCADLAARKERGFEEAMVLPPYRHLVIDEAHQFEDVAAEHLGVRVSERGVEQTLGRLLTRKRRGRLAALIEELERLGRRSAGGDERSGKRRGDGREGPSGEAVPENAAGAREQAWLRGSARTRALRTIDRLIPRVDEVREVGQRFFEAVAAFYEERASVRDDDVPLRVRAGDADGAGWAALEAAARALEEGFERLAQELRRLVGELDSLREEDPKAIAASWGPELEGLMRRCSRHALALGDWLSGVVSGQVGALERAGGGRRDERVHWIEPRRVRGGRRKRRGAKKGRQKKTAGSRVRWWTLCAAPREVGPLLARMLYPKLGGVVLTSATLTVDRRFDFVTGRLGLDLVSAGAESGDRRTSSGQANENEGGDRFVPAAPIKHVDRVVLESPFDFERQALLGVVADMPDPREGAYEARCHEALERLAEASGGGAFFLFTSHGALAKAHERLAPELERRGFVVLRHGQAPRTVLLERFRASGRAVLFGADSFWEGVDVQGAALRLVVVTRLPFRVPSHPLQQARVEAIEERGGNPFFELSLPQAELRLRQGFGRLVRSRRDRGAVVLLDGRVISKNYGARLLRSLPPARRVVADLDGVASEVGRAVGG